MIDKCSNDNVYFPNDYQGQVTKDQPREILIQLICALKSSPIQFFNQIFIDIQLLVKFLAYSTKIKKNIKKQTRSLKPTVKKLKTQKREKLYRLRKKAKVKTAAYSKERTPPPTPHTKRLQSSLAQGLYFKGF